MVRNIVKQKTGISLRQFKTQAKLWYPNQSKRYYDKGKLKASYNTNTKKVTIIKPKRK